MATVNIKVYAVVVVELDTYSYDGTYLAMQEPLYVSKSAAEEALEVFTKNNYGYAAASIEEYTLHTNWYMF